MDTRILHAALQEVEKRAERVSEDDVLASRFHGGVVSTGGMNGERCSWPGMIRGVETRTHPLEG
ncbi:hypothetical protein, partial [Brachybacterium muris]|uniref:hypothetical protein n=1 Tax=Brachybacterium muris TaxID=219301 RepID=UPI001ED9C4F7